MRRLDWIAVAIALPIAFAVAMLVSSCGAADPSMDSPKGWTHIDGQLYKRCDGKNLLYRYFSTDKPGLTVVENAPECGGSP